MLIARRGATLIELTVALVAGAVVLGAVARLYVAQETAARRLFVDARDEARLREAASILPVTLRAADPSEGDIPPGLATDTALELRETIATGVVCGVGAGSVTLPDDSDDGATLGAYLARPDAGDTLWVLAPDSAGTWRWAGLGVTAVASAACGPIGALDGGVSGMRLTTSADPRASGGAVGAPLRVTRRARFSLYRSADGAWWLGYRAWSAATGRLATVQPASGPYESPSKAGAPFRYFDGDGAELTVPVVATRRIARVDVHLRSARGAGEPPLPRGARRDSLATSISPRNR